MLFNFGLEGDTTRKVTSEVNVVNERLRWVVKSCVYKKGDLIEVKLSEVKSSEVK